MYYKQRFLALTCSLGPSDEHIKSLQLLDTRKVVNLKPKNLTAKNLLLQFVLGQALALPLLSITFCLGLY